MSNIRRNLNNPYLNVNGKLNGSRDRFNSLRSSNPSSNRRIVESDSFELDDEDLLDDEELDIKIDGIDLNDLDDETDDEFNDELLDSDELDDDTFDYDSFDTSKLLSYRRFGDVGAEQPNTILDMNEDEDDNEIDINLNINIDDEDEDDEDEFDILLDDEDDLLDDDFMIGIEEGNTSASAGGEYNTPNAFTGNPDDDKDAEHYNPDDFKYGIKVKKSNVHFKKTGNTPVNELYTGARMFNFNYDLNRLTEARNSNTDDLSPKEAVNNNIKEINEMLRLVERKIKNNLKLRVENELSQRDYWKPTMVKIKKMNESLMRISRMLNDLGA